MQLSTSKIKFLGMDMSAQPALEKVASRVQSVLYNARLKFDAITVQLDNRRLTIITTEAAATVNAVLIKAGAKQKPSGIGMDPVIELDHVAIGVSPRKTPGY
jgi:hypothetical protein